MLWKIFQSPKVSKIFFLKQESLNYSITYNACAFTKLNITSSPNISRNMSEKVKAVVFRCSSKHVFIIISQISRKKAPVLDSLSNKFSGPQACKFIKKRVQHRYFLAKFGNFLRAPFFYRITSVSEKVNDLLNGRSFHM